MSEIEHLFEELPRMKIVKGESYKPVVAIACDGYFSAFYLPESANVLYSSGGVPTPEAALKGLIERVNGKTA